MAALLQSYPQPSSTMSILQSRPSSSSGVLSTKPHNQISRHSSNNKIHMQRNSFNGINNGIPISNYPGQSFMASIAPYAFTSTPELNLPGYPALTLKDSQTNASLSTKTGNNTISSRSSEYENRTRLPSETSISTSLLRPSTGDKSVSLDDSIPPTPRSTRPGSTLNRSSNSNKNLSISIAQSASKSSPGRYRRTHTQSVDLSNSSSSTTAQLNTNELEPHSICTFKDFSLQMPQLSDFSLHLSSNDRLQLSGNEDSQRYRPKSCQSNKPVSCAQNFTQKSIVSQPNQRLMNNYRDQTELPLSLSASNRPYSSHRRDESLDSSNPAQGIDSGISQTKREDNLIPVKQKTFVEPNRQSASDNSKSRPEISGSVNLPLRASPTDTVKRIFNTSPLSKPIDISTDSPSSKNTFASAANATLQQPSGSITSPVITSNSSSSAAVQLTALKKNNGKKKKNFKLRRAFSFGSAAELRSATSTSKAANELDSESPKRKEGTSQDELDDEQIKIAQRQEAGGIGSGIYTGQGNIFSGSTDNLSISSTASSASIMIRKMGKGMKKSTRSIVGLFRPKQNIGPSPDLTNLAIGEAHVSMVNVEAERGNSFQKNTSLFTEEPKVETLRMEKIRAQMESDTLELGRVCSSSTENSSRRKSMIGGDKERAEVLTAVKKGILKRSGLVLNSSLTIVPPQYHGTSAFQTPQIVTGNDTPNSTAPSTPNDDHQGHLRHGSSSCGNEDYFTSALRLHGSPRSQSATLLNPSGKRNTKFSPRIQFHDTWPSGEYDRRGEIATCNRLTPMLAQQIKEELNNFKMEMEVHENSKIYTHFF